MGAVWVLSGYIKLSVEQRLSQEGDDRTGIATLTANNFWIKQHLAGNRNPADGPSRRPDYEIGYGRPTARLLATLAAFESYNLLPAIKTAQATDTLATDVNKKIVDIPMVAYSGLTER